MAWAYARLANPEGGNWGERENCVRVIRDAMLAHPQVVAGSKRFVFSKRYRIFNLEFLLASPFEVMLVVNFRLLHCHKTDGRKLKSPLLEKPSDCVDFTLFQWYSVANLYHWLNRELCFIHFNHAILVE